MATFSDLRQVGSLIRYDSDALNPMEPRLFDVGWAKAEGHHLGTYLGRGDAHFLDFSGCQMVLRFFRRGGLLGRVNRDLYLWAGIDRSRPMRELALLAWMREEGLPVPRPIAALHARSGLLYRAAILTERIPDARPMEDVLRDGGLEPAVWGRVGLAIRQMHEAGVYHSDLNCRNVLIDATEQAWLIDFDKCARRVPGPWTVHNLDRFQRSLRKMGVWDAKGWSRLMADYRGTSSA